MKELIRTGLDRLDLSPSVPENAAELLEHYGLMAKDVAAAAKRVIARKKAN